jgi:transposase
VKRLVAQELTLSFVPDAEQRLWRAVTRKKYQLRCDRIRLQNQLESLLEEAHIKLSSFVSDLLGLSAQRMLKLALEELRLIDDQIGLLDREMASLLCTHQDAVQRLAEVPGLGVDSAQQIIAEVGPTAATFPSAKCLSSWVGACPGDDESAGVNHSHRSPKGNRQMRRILNQAANAAARTKGSIFEIVYRRSVPRLGHNQAIGAIAHRHCRLIWLILHQGVRYEERGPAVTKRSKQLRTWRMIRQLRSLGYHIEPPNPQPSQEPAR